MHEVNKKAFFMNRLFSCIFAVLLMGRIAIAQTYSPEVEKKIKAVEAEVASAGTDELLPYTGIEHGGSS